MNQDSTFRLHGISRLDSLKLKHEPGVLLEQEVVPEGSYGEPSTFVMIVTLMAIKTLAAYLLRKKHSEEVVAEVEEVRADGTRIIRRVHIISDGSEPGKDTDKIIKQLTEGDIQ